MTTRGPRRRPLGRSNSDDDGSVSVYLAVWAVALMAMAGLVIDGGAAIAARARAADLAQQAARAGADALSPVSLRGLRPADRRGLAE